MLNKEKLYRIIFESDTRGGKMFDIFLLWAILLSVVIVLVDSIPTFSKDYRLFFITLEWIFTVIFSIEYILRINICKKPRKYVLSWWGIIDLFSILPSFLSLFFAGYQYLLVIRIFRLLRIFRILKLVRYSSESLILIRALRDSTRKIVIFLFVVLSTMIFMGTLMYVVEGGCNGFTSIPQSIYWAIVTITTVGYGDIVPITVIGKIISSISMLIGYAIIAVPTGIITVEMTKASKKHKICKKCNEMNAPNANFCAMCGNAFEE